MSKTKRNEIIDHLDKCLTTFVEAVNEERKKLESEYFEEIEHGNEECWSELEMEEPEAPFFIDESMEYWYKFVDNIMGYETTIIINIESGVVKRKRFDGEQTIVEELIERDYNMFSAELEELDLWSVPLYLFCKGNGFLKATKLSHGKAFTFREYLHLLKRERLYLFEHTKHSLKTLYSKVRYQLIQFETFSFTKAEIEKIEREAERSSTYFSV